MRARDDGHSLVEGVVLGLALFVPLILGVVVVTGFHRATLAADAAAREAARAWSTSAVTTEAKARAEGAARRAAADYGFGSVEVHVDGTLAPGGRVTVTTRIGVAPLGHLLTVTRTAVADVDRLRSSAEPP